MIRLTIAVATSFALCSLEPSLAVSDGARGAHSLVLDDALALADDNNLDLAQARARLAQSETGVETARVALLPTAAVQGKYTHNNYAVDLPVSEFSSTALQVGDALVTTAGDLYTQTGKTPSADTQSALAGYRGTKAGLAAAKPIIITPMDQLDASGTLQVPLIVPWAWYQLRSANRTADAARAGYAVSRAQTMLQVAQYFYQAAGADEVMTAREHAVTVAKKTLDDATAKVEEGAASVVERDRAQIAYDRAVQSAAEAAAQSEQAYRTLTTATGVRGAYRVDASLPVVAVTSANTDLVAVAHERRPELVQDYKQVQASAASSTSNLARWLPTLSAFGQIRAFNYGGFSGNNYALAAGLQLDWVLYDGGARDAARHLANAQRAEAEARLALFELTVRDDIVNAERVLAVRRSNVSTSQRAVVLSQQTLDRVRTQHDAGAITQLDLLSAQDALVASELTLAQARFDLALAELTLQRTVGTFPKPPPSARK